MENEKYYVSSDGTKTLMKDMEFTHLSNSLAKKYREIFNYSGDELSTKLQEIDDIKQEIHKRINNFYSLVTNE